MQKAIIHHKNFAKCNAINTHGVDLTTKRPYPMVVNYLEFWLMSLNFSNLARFLLLCNLKVGNRLRVIFKLIRKDAIMPNLILEEYRGLSRDELGQALREEARKMYGNAWIERNFQAKEHALRSLGDLQSKQQKMLFFKDLR